MLITEPPAHVEEHLWPLRRFGNNMAGLYGLPVYLVGSALAETNPTPRDWDVRIDMPDDEFAIRYGDPALWVGEGVTGEWTEVRWRWARDCTNRTKRGWKDTGLFIDFQIYPVQHVRRLRYQLLPRMRIDMMPDAESVTP